MIGQTVVNVKLSHARTRISTLVAGATLLLLVTTLSGVMARIPMVALAAVMMIVAISTMNWGSVNPLMLRRMPLSETIVMVVTVAIVVASGNLAVGVAVGVVLALALFARRVARNLRVDRTVAAGGTSVRYAVHGPLYFGSSNTLIERFAFAHDPVSVIIDLTHAQIWDATSVVVLDAIESKYRAKGTAVVLEGLDERSHAFRARLSDQV
jgi:SulP family sulfate permease